MYECAYAPRIISTLELLYHFLCLFYKQEERARFRGRFLFLPKYIAPREVDALKYRARGTNVERRQFSARFFIEYGYFFTSFDLCKTARFYLKLPRMNINVDSIHA